MSVESFENSIHRIIAMQLTPEESSIAAQLNEIWTIKCGEMWARQPKHELDTSIENLREH